MTVATHVPPHSRLDDAQALLIGSLFVALAVLLFRHAGLVTGGTAGLAFLIHYAQGWSLGALLFVLNLPFYFFGYKALGLRYTLKTFVALSLVSLHVEWLPLAWTFGEIEPALAAILGGFLAGTGLLVLIRHEAGLGGFGILAIYLQKTRGWRAGHLQMGADAVVMLIALALLDPKVVLISLLGAASMNMVISINHRSGRYQGV